MDIQTQIIRYIDRYAPSEKKLLQYIQKKGVKKPDAFLQTVHYDEKKAATLWIRSYISTGKGRFQIYTKLIQKQFAKESIEELLSQHQEELEQWDQYKTPLLHQRDTWQKQGKSKRAIAQALCNKYPYFSEQINTLLEDIDEKEALSIALQSYQKHHTLSLGVQRQKCIQVFLRKGFVYRDILSVLNTLS